MTAFLRNVFSLRQGVQENDRRLPYLDFLRGEVMLLVLLGHSGVPINGYLLLFHMPLFFLLSGYLRFLKSDQAAAPFPQYAKKQFLRLMIPNYVFELLNYALWCAACVATGKSVPIGSALLNILLCAELTAYGGFVGRFWFLPCMFVSSLLFYWVLRLLKTKTAKYVALAVLPIASWATMRFLPFRLPLQLDSALLGTAYLLIGYLGGSVIQKCLDVKNAAIAVVLAALAILCVWIARKNGASLTMFENKSRAFHLVLLASIAGSFAFTMLCKVLFAASRHIPIVYRLIRWFGANSLLVYPVHIEIKCVTYLGIALLSTKYWYILFPFLVFTTIPAVNIISVYFPFVLGKPRIKIGA